MKTFYQTIDGKTFEDHDLAKQHEEKVLKNSQARRKKLEELSVFINFQEGTVLEVGCNFDDAGNWKKMEKLTGTKESLLQHISVNSKYWNIGNQVDIFVWKNDIITV